MVTCLEPGSRSIFEVGVFLGFSFFFESIVLIVNFCHSKQWTWLIATLVWGFSLEVHSQDARVRLPSITVQEEQHIDAMRVHKAHHFEAKPQAVAPSSRPTVTPSSASLTAHPCAYESEIAKKPPFKTVSLTFDDGPSPERTEFILSILEKYNIPATFFLIGEKVKKHPDLVERIAKSGHHLMGNHSWQHPNFHEIDVDQQEREIAQTQQAVQLYTAEKYFRYPYGNSTCESREQLHQLGYKIVGWHIDSCDWAFDKTGSVSEHDAQICEVKAHNTSSFIDHTLEAIRERGGGIVLLHDIHPNTLKQLEALIVRLQREEFHFERLDGAAFEAFLN